MVYDFSHSKVKNKYGSYSKISLRRQYLTLRVRKNRRMGSTQ